jgi:hypothetical protein
MQGFMPGEKLEEQEIAVIKKHGAGILQITNIRILWRRTGDAHYLLNTSRFSVKPPVRIAATKEDNVETYVMQIEFIGDQPKIYFRFTGSEAKIRAEQIKDVLDKVPDEKDITEDSMETEQLMKMVQLKENEGLRNFFQEMVIDKK